eukprot:690123-Amorphochlora_amoeboformis.AAC.1
MSSSKIGKEVLTQYHKTESKFEAVYVDLVSLVFQAIPTALLQAAILYMADVSGVCGCVGVCLGMDM